MNRSDGTQTSRVTDKGQTRILKSLREKYGIKPGDEIASIEGDDGITLPKKGDLPYYGVAKEDMTEDEAEQVSEALKDDMNSLQRPDRGR